MLFYQFQIMHFKHALFNRVFINWILEAEQPGESRIKEMEKFYQKPQQKKPKRFIRKSSLMHRGRYLAKNPIARLFGLG